MVAKFDSIGKAEAEFQKMVQFVKQASASGELRADEVEQGLFETALTIGKHLLKAFTEQAGDGDHGPRVQHQEQTLVRSETKKTKKYRSVFGVLEINRYVYAPGPKKLAVSVSLSMRNLDCLQANNLMCSKIGRSDSASRMRSPRASDLYVRICSA